jgi:hypothetical protein
MWTRKDAGMIEKRLMEALAWRRTVDDWWEDGALKEGGRVWKMRESVLQRKEQMKLWSMRTKLTERLKLRQDWNV